MFRSVKILHLAGFVCLVGCAQSAVSIDDVDAQIEQIRLETQTSQASVTADYKQGFKGALYDAVLQSGAYRAAKARQAVAMAGIDVTASMQKLQTMANVRLGAISEGGDIGSNITSGASGALTVSKLIYDGGANDATITQAMAQALAAGVDIEIASNEIALSAAQAWVDVWENNQRFELLSDRLQKLDDSLAQMQRMVGLGVVDKATVENANRQAASLRQEQAQIRGQSAEASARFAQYFGTSPSDVSFPSTIGPSPQLKDWEDSPALTRSAADVVLARAQLAEAQAAFSPVARLQAGVTTPLEQGETTDTSVGVIFEYTLGDGGRRKARLKASEDGIVAAQAQLIEQRRRIKADLSASIASLQAITEVKPDLNEEIRLAASEVKTARSQLQTGQTDLRELVEAELAHYRAEDRMVSLRAQEFKARLSAMALSGELARTIGVLK